jgi:hypothetical protein
MLNFCLHHPGMVHRVWLVVLRFRPWWRPRYSFICCYELCTNCVVPCLQVRFCNLLEDGDQFSINNPRNGVVWLESFEKCYTRGALAIGIDDEGNYLLIVLCKYWERDNLWNNLGVRAVAKWFQQASPQQNRHACPETMCPSGVTCG